MNECEYRAGSVMYRREDETEVIAQPHELMYSTVSICATHFWNGTEWELIWNDE